jgi:CheY-like chemotaxis protein
MVCRQRPDVVFLDLTMPGMNGFEALAILKDDPAVANIPVFIVTSRVLSDKERRQLLEGAAGIVSKEDLEKTDMADLLSQVIKRPGSQAATRQESTLHE